MSIIFRLCFLMLAIASATVMAASSECTVHSGPGAGNVVTFTYTHFRAFLLLVGCSITAAILEAVAVYLQLSLSAAAVAAAAGADEEHEGAEVGVCEGEDGDGGPDRKKEGISATEVTLVLLDLLVPALLYPAMGAAYVAADFYSDQISTCTHFSTQVGQAKILSLAACAAVMLGGAAKVVQLPFNLPAVLA